MFPKDHHTEAFRESIAGEAGDRTAMRPAQGLVIETTRLTLRRPLLTDAPAIAELADNPRVAEMLVGMPHPYRVSDALDWIGDEVPEGGQKHLVQLAESAEPIGVVTLDFRRNARLPTLGAWLGEAFWGRGYATEVAQAVIDYAFLHQRHERISFTCRVTNSAGRRLIEKCGFQPTAQELSPSAFFRAVVPVDRFTLDRDTWKGLRAWAPLRVATGANGLET